MATGAGNPERFEYLLPDREHRLLGCGLCRLAAPVFDRPELFSVLEASEAFADGLLRAAELGRARQFAIEIARSHAEMPEQEKFASAVALAASVTPPSSLSFYKSVGPTTAGLITTYLRGALELLPGVVALTFPGYAAVFDDLAPRRATSFFPAWRTDTVLALARVMYDSRDFSAMPILADALQDAGCDNDDVLNHCRGTSLTHVRGCWVVDLILGKR